MTVQWKVQPILLFFSANHTFFSSFSSGRMGVGLGMGMFAELQLAIQGLRQHERIHSRFNDLASLGEGDREHALDLY